MSRCLLLVVALGGCYSGYIDANLHPAVAPQMANVPSERRDQIFDSASARPDPEQRRRDMTPRARKLELAAAVTAAVIGNALSYSHNVIIGVGSDFDETGNLDTRHAMHAPEPGRLVEDPASSALVPWVKVPSPTAESQPAQ